MAWNVEYRMRCRHIRASFADMQPPDSTNGITFSCYQNSSTEFDILLTKIAKPLLQTVKDICMDEFRLAPKCTFPNDSNPPSRIKQFANHPPVPFPVGPDFFAPEVRIGGGQTEETAAMAMSVPVASVNKYDRAIFRENEIGRTGKPSVGHPVAVSPSKQPLADDQFYAGISAADTRHHAAAGKAVNDISHDIQCRWKAISWLFVWSSSSCKPVLQPFSKHLPAVPIRHG